MSVGAGTIVLYPAIDIRAGRAVRLLRGDYERETAYDADPLEAARRWLADGATALHVVDLDGARGGEPVQLEHAARIAAAVDVPVQLGGGIRDENAAEAALRSGIARVVLGTRAQRDPEFVERLVGAYGAAIVAAVDARAGRVAVEGWEQPTATAATELIAELADRGVERIVYTPVEVDGTLEGPGLDGLAAVAEAAGDGGAELIYSGGVGSLADLERLAALGLPALGGVIVGRALYERRFSVADATKALAEAP